MECCNLDARARGAGAGWEAYGAPAYAPYATAYYPPHAHDPYRYYRYDYPAHPPIHPDHVMPFDYGAYAAKDARVRRALARRDARATPTHMPLPPTPPLECGLSGRSSGYCEPQMWPHYQMGVMGGWSSPGMGWASRASCSREYMRYPSDCRPMKGPLQSHGQPCMQDGRLTPYPYEEPTYTGDNVRRGNTPDYPARAIQAEAYRKAQERVYPEPRVSPVQEKPKPPVVPLPGFQQAFGSTEIGKFSEAFTRTEIPVEDPSESFGYESFSDWEPPDAPWSGHPNQPGQPAAREIKCEENY